MTKALTKKRSRAIPPLEDGQDIAMSNEEKAEALAKNFEKIYKTTDHLGNPECNRLIETL